MSRITRKLAATIWIFSACIAGNAARAQDAEAAPASSSSDVAKPEAKVEDSSGDIDTLLNDIAEPKTADASVSVAAEESPTQTPSDPTAVAQMPEAAAEAAHKVAAVQAPPDGARIEEIVVTANKRAENLGQMAGAVTAVSREQLERTGSSNFADYLSTAPGVNFSQASAGYSVITIRGVSSDTYPGLTQPAVGVYYDDIPLTDPAAPMVIPDVDAFDAERVEILRGPQGALYGSSSLGGAINYIPTQANLAQTQFRFFGSGSRTENASIGGSMKMMGNVPLIEDTLALRLVGAYTKAPGYIDNVGTGIDGANSSRTAGGRAILGWAISDTTRVSLSGIYQGTRLDDAGYVVRGLGDLKKTSLDPEPFKNNLRLADLHFETESDYGTLVAIGGYQDKSSAQHLDGATALGIQALELRLPLSQIGRVKGYTGEIRFISPQSDVFEWLAGGSYANRNEKFKVSLNAAVLADTVSLLSSILNGLSITQLNELLESGTLFDETADITAPEKALFAEATYKPSDQWKITFGGRYYMNEVATETRSTGVLVLPAGGIDIKIGQTEKAKGFNPKVSVTWLPTDMMTFYALMSKGYRLGGPNIVPSNSTNGIPPFYNPDQVYNYELGTKTRWFDERLGIDITGFLIDWKNFPLQLQSSDGLFKYLKNAGNARITGVETAVTARPVESITYQGSFTWLRPVLTENFDPNNGRPAAPAGTQLPGSPTWALSNTILGTWSWGDFTPVLAFIHRYEGPSASSLQFPDIKKGNYNLFDLRLGTKFSESISINLYGKNLSDQRGVTAANNVVTANGSNISQQYLVQPRTFGLDLTYDFGN
ncbi:MAG: TonB-dependent receptor [Pseudomonadota bacterium]